LDIYLVEKSISVKLCTSFLKKQLRQLCGDIGNAYVNAFTKKVYARAGPDGTLEGSIVIIVKALYGLRSSSERWHAHCRAA
jgi:hypothetical protein